VGTNVGGQPYRGSVGITKNGDSYDFKWTLLSGESYSGVGIIDGDKLAVGFYGVTGGTAYYGVVHYRIEKGGKLEGKWSVGGGNGKVYTETLTKAGG
jgi:hypothetical protein